MLGLSPPLSVYIYKYVYMYINMNKDIYGNINLSMEIYLIYVLLSPALSLSPSVGHLLTKGRRSDERWYAVHKDTESNTLLVSTRPEVRYLICAKHDSL